MIDTHSHLWFDHFDVDRGEVIGRAKAVGVHTMIQVGCDEASSRAAIGLAEAQEGMFATVGLHPTEVKQLGVGSQELGAELSWIRDLAKSSKKVVALGETGIDYYHEPFDAKAQQEAFRFQCEIAKELGLPVVVHLRNTKRPEEGRVGLNQAEQDSLEVLDAVQMPSGKVVFHCFSAGKAMAEEVIRRGWLISFSGVVTYPNSGELREIAASIPSDQFVVETDCPFLPPQSHRGERNEPSYVLETAQVLAQFRGVSVEEVERLTDENAKRLFGIG